MSTNFPTGLDSFTDPSGTSQLNNPPHSVQHANANDAIAALETKVGINDSADTSSLDYKVANKADLVDGIVPLSELPFVTTMITLSANLSGGAPSNSIGLNGDYILDASNGALWGPKASGAWPGSPGITFALA